MIEEYPVRRMKGDVAEAICRNHLIAMGLKVEMAGVEHFARTFANRPREGEQDTNEAKIHKYIGLLPDILAGDANLGYYFVEVKFRDSVAAEKLLPELLWTYRHVIFAEFDCDFFCNITASEWKNLGKPSPTVLDRFSIDISKIIESEIIAIPILFYLLIKDDIKGATSKFRLYLIHFNQYEGRGRFEIHEAGTKLGEIKDLALASFLEEFDRCYITTVVPVLNQLFSASIDITSASMVVPSEQNYENGSLVHLCYQVANTSKGPIRRGVYFAELLKNPDVSKWLTDKKLEEDRFSLKAELEREGLSTSRRTVCIDGKTVPLYIKEYQRDFDFYLG